MRRYARQYDDSSCGPIAILNVIKWAGYRCTIKNDLKHIKKLCGYYENRPRGVCPDDLDRVLRLCGRRFKFEVRRLTVCKVKDIIKHLRNEGAVVVDYGYKKLKEVYIHNAILVAVSEGDIFTGINFFRNKTISKLKIKKLKEYCRCYTLDGGVTYEYPVAWFLTKY